MLPAPPHQQPHFQQPHVHGPNCSHSHNNRAMVSPQIPRVFWVFSCVSGQLFQKLFLQLPLMIQFYQIYLMIKTMCCIQPMDFYFHGISSIMHRVPSPRLKQLFEGFSIPFLFFNYVMIYYVYNYRIPYLESSYAIDFLLKCSLFCSIILYFTLFFTDPGFLNSKEDKAEMQKIIEKRPEVSNPRNFCPFCSQPKIARSFHCNFCGSCITKWEKHNFIFNRCIGAGNQIIYLVFECSYAFLTTLCFLSFFMKKTQLLHHTVMGSLVFFLIIYNLWSSYQETLIQAISIFYNVTTYELQNFRRLNYLWKNKHGEFFNPFDKGPLQNFREAIESIMPLQPPSQNNKNNNDIEQNQDYPINHPESILNWRRAKFFTVMDIPNSPLKDVLIEELKKAQNFEKERNLNFIQKENPFSAPFSNNNAPKARIIADENKTSNERKEPEEEALVTKSEEEKINPFTN